MSTVPDTSDPLPVLLVRRGEVAMRSVRALQTDSRVELLVTDELTPNWISLSGRMAGVVVATNGDPLNSLGYAITASIRAPLVVAIARRFQRDQEDLMRAGAAACITMPFTKAHVDHLMPLLAGHAALARIDTGLRLFLDPIGRTVRYRDSSIRLSQREFAVLYCLSGRGGQPVAIEELLTSVWGDARPAERNRRIVEFYIFQLRKKLERLGIHDVIGTVRGYGYALAHHTTDASDP